MDGASLMSTLPFVLQCPDPEETGELPIQVPLLPLPRPGSYLLDLLVDAQPLGSIQIRAAQVSARRLVVDGGQST